MQATGEYKRTYKPDGVNSIATIAALKGAKKCRETKEKKRYNGALYILCLNMNSMHAKSGDIQNATTYHYCPI